MGGVGKSCLAAQLIRDADVGVAFERLLWVSVSAEPDVVALLSRLHFQLKSSKLPSSVETELEAALRGCTHAYIHGDLDVLDPAVFPCTCCPTAGGLSLQSLLRSIAAVRRSARLVTGCGMTECCGDFTSHAATLEAVVDALVAALR